ncbi:MAG: prepilin-type N-terminal cleavage/methylation domain-containing protein [Planctomycetota bacterium]|nr:prepilin-type N-terminal cleavage/methylation domain-containing protein [Planctomycetota bacterium]
MKKEKEMKEKGFTLIELLVVMLILSILITIAVVAFGGAIKRANITAAESMIKNITVALNEYEAKRGYYPIADYPNDAGIVAVCDVTLYGPERLLDIKEKDLVQSKYVPGKKVIADPWKTPYRYRSAYDEKNNTREGIHNKDTFDLWSCGPDLKDNYRDSSSKVDDIVNW